MAAAIAAVREAFAAQARGEALNVPRTRLQFWSRRLNVMAGGMRAPARFAIKAYGGSAHHIFLYAEEEGLLAVIEADLLGQLRTGAASAVASRAARTRRRPPRRIDRCRTPCAHPGARATHGRPAGRAYRIRARPRPPRGLRAALAVGARAYRCMPPPRPRPRRRTPISWSRPPPRRNRCCGCVDRAGTHVNAMGANAATRRELDSELVLRAAVVVTDDVAQAQGEAGELIELAAAGRLRLEQGQGAASGRRRQLPPRSRRDHAVQIARRRDSRTLRSPRWSTTEPRPAGTAGPSNGAASAAPNAARRKGHGPYPLELRRHRQFAQRDGAAGGAGAACRPTRAIISRRSTT